MLVSRTAVRVHVCPEPTDMRKGYNGLFALARDVLRADPMSGHLFLFVARNRKRAKVLYWDGTGLCILMKRLETGRFVAPWERLERPIQMTPSELQLFLEGAEALGRTLSPPELRFSA